ncbi:MAG: hypothetical protein ACI9UQ_001302, partial [Candidatus Krumholzibacteriia bacterium]
AKPDGFSQKLAYSRGLSINRMHMDQTMLQTPSIWPDFGD